MKNLTLKQLRYFESLAQHGHFGRAAEACAISQPALSVQIRELEETLGTELFERSARQIRLTGFGESFALRCREILRAVDELGDLARASQTGLAGRLRMGVIPTVAPYLLPAIVARLGDRHPGLEVQLRETITPRLIQDLAAGRLDAAIVALPVSEPSLTEIALFSEDFVLVRPKADEDKPVPSRDMLREMRLLLLEEGHCFRDQALSFCSLQAVSPRELLDGSSLTTLVQMVAAGIGVTLIPEMAVPLETRSAEVSLARFEHPTPSRMIGMVWRRTSPLTTQLHQVSAIVSEAAAEARARRPAERSPAD